MTKQLLPILFASTSLLSASTVLWTATGEVTSATGVYTDGINAETPVSIEMRYDDQAGNETPKTTPFIIDYDFRSALDLEISVTIGDQVWTGFVATANIGSPYTLFLNDGVFPGTSDILTATTQEDDGATLSPFPLAQADQNNLIQLKFNTSSHTFLSNTIVASSFNVELITAASGSLQTGLANKVSFSLDPASVTVENEVLPTPTPVLTLVRDNDNLAISWQSLFGVNYLVQSSFTMEEDSWNDIITLPGNDTTLTQNVAIATGFAVYYRVIAIPAEEL